LGIKKIANQIAEPPRTTEDV